VFRAGIGGEATWTKASSFVRGPAAGGRNGGLARKHPQPAASTRTEATRPGLIQQARQDDRMRLGYEVTGWSGHHGRRSSYIRVRICFSYSTDVRVTDRGVTRQVLLDVRRASAVGVCFS
jgi:hypothetical protein